MKSSVPDDAAIGVDFSTNPIIQRLDALSIPHTTYFHVPCMTAEELVANVPLPPPSSSSSDTHN